MASAEIDFERSLNPDQHAAATHGDGPQLVIAGAGSGKTRVITYRIAWLVKRHGVDPREITAVTFTNKAASEMRERVEQLLGIHPLTTFVGTFHRFSLRMLRRWGDRVGLKRDFAILDTSDQKNLIKKAIGGEELDETAFTPQAMLGAISSAKNRLLDPAAYERQADDFFRQRVAKVYRRYQKLLMEASGVDFDDMIRLAVRLLETEEDIQRRVQASARFLLVDEFQDTNHAQMRLVHAIAGTDGNLTAVGDEDQGIYRWRGAELDNILGFEKAFSGATVYKLEQNYRSTQTILDASGAVVERNESRRGKKLWTESGQGDPIILYRARDEQDEAGWVARGFQQLKSTYGYRGMAVLVRTNAQTRALEDAFLRRRIPYALIGGVRFYERAEIKDLVAYLRLLRNPRDTLSYTRVVNRPPRGIGNTTQQAVNAQAEAAGVTPWDILDKDQVDGVAERSRRALMRFRDLLTGLMEDAERLPLPSLLERIIEVTDYGSLYAKDDAENQSKRENIAEFLSAAQEFTEKNAYGGPDDLLTAFLDHASLTADIDGLDPSQGVSLMTLHSAKGLEFPVVAVTGLEDGLLPHFNAQSQVEDVEEERRLLYVGMTRAEKRLFLTTCRRRRIAGRYQDQQESPFVAEIPTKHLELEESPQLFADPPAAAFGQGRGGYGGSSYGGGQRGGGQYGGSQRGGSQRGGGGDKPYLEGDVYRFFGNDSAKLPTPAAKTPSTSASRSSRPEPRATGQATIDLPGFEPTPAAPTPRAPRSTGGSNTGGSSNGGGSGAGATVRKGTRVQHRKLGKGIVLGLEGEGDNLRLTVLFERIGKRKLLARYANLEVV